MTRPPALAVLAIVMSALLLAACSSGPRSADMTSDASKHGSLSYSEALTKVNDYVGQSIAVFPAGTSIKADGLGAISVPCSDADNAPPSTPVQIQPGFDVEGLAAKGNEKYVSAFVEFWKTRGWHVKTDMRPKIERVAMGSPDGFVVDIQVTADGTRVSLGGGTPCVHPKAVSPAPHS